MRGFLIRCVVTGTAVLVASQIIPGIIVESFAAGIVAVLVLALLNALVRPLLYLLSAPFILVTLGLFMVLINAFLLHLVAFFVKGFHIQGFWPAVGGAIQNWFAFMLALVFLLFRPQGLFGEKIIERV